MYIIELNEDGTRRRVYEEPEPKSAQRRVYEKPEPKSAQRVIYASRRGGKPLNIGINQAKRVARAADKADRARVVKLLGSGLPMQAIHHQELVRARHRYYHEQHDEFVRSHSSGDGKHG
jgi:hypothetical protein